MAYNYAKEKRKFDAEWKRKALWYRKEGMSEDDIEAMYHFDLAQFNRDRAYESRRRPLETACGTCYIQAPEVPSERYSWIDEVSDQQLADRLLKLSESDIELLTLLIYDGISQTEAADILSRKQYDISRQFARILKSLSETA